MKRLLLKPLTARSVARIFRPLMRGRAAIFMLHRFRDDQARHDGHDPEALRRALAYLRHERYELTALGELFDRLRDGRPLNRCVAFTLDDGHEDQVTVAGPVFAEFDCPATVFVTAGFLDGRLWFWWDQIQYVFDQTGRPTLEMSYDGERLAYPLADRAARRRAAADFAKRCKLVAEDEKHRYIAALAEGAGVELPRTPPPRYAPMTWHQMRAWERRGMSFAPHSVSHPILARTHDAQSRAEILDSWSRLRAEAAHPVPVFSYPNGLEPDFGEREYRYLEEAGLEGAVTGIPGFASPAAYGAPHGRFRIPRLGYPDDFEVLVQYVSGLERLKEVLRGGP